MIVSMHAWRVMNVWEVQLTEHGDGVEGTTDGCLAHATLDDGYGACDRSHALRAVARWLAGLADELEGSSGF